MNPEAWIALIVGGAALAVNLGVVAVGYGVMRGTLVAIAARVSALETEMSSLNDLKVTVAGIAARQETWIEQLKELNASIRWMREPQSTYEPAEPPRRRP